MKRDTKITTSVLLIGLILVGISYRPKKGRTARPTSFRPWTSSDVEAFVTNLKPSGIPVDAVALVYTAESGLDPHASSGVAYGLCQAIPSTLKAIGWTRTPREFQALNVAQQAPWIARLLSYQIRTIGFVPTTALDLFVANLSPMAARQHSDVIYREGTAAYASNRGLDTARKGFIDRNDVAQALARAAQEPSYRTVSSQLREWEKNHVDTNSSRPIAS